MTVNLTPLMQALLSLLAVLITYYLIPWIKAKTTAQKQAEINAWVKIVVQAAEQLFTGPGQGAVKKAYVLEFLESKGFSVDTAELDKMIEAAVLAVNKGVL